MKATDAQVQAIVDEIDPNDGASTHDRIRRVLDPILDEVVGEALRTVRSYLEAVDNRDERATVEQVVDEVAAEMGVEL